MRRLIAGIGGVILVAVLAAATAWLFQGLYGLRQEELAAAATATPTASPARTPTPALTPTPTPSPTPRLPTQLVTIFEHPPEETANLFSIALSPDGKLIAYSYGTWEGPIFGVPFSRPTGHFAVRDADTGKLLFSQDNISILDLDFSPDGKTISFVEGSTIVLMRPDGTGRRELPRGGDYDMIEGKPAWSADGKSIAFASKKLLPGDTADSFLWVVNADGSTVRKVYGGNSRDLPGVLGWPQWFPDGKDILFSMGQHVDDAAAFRIPAQGGTPKRLTPPDQVDAGDLISPDGRRIAYLIEDSKGILHLWLMQADGTGHVSLALKGGLTSEPVAQLRWMPDSRRLLIKSGRDVDPSISVLDVETREVTKLAERIGPGLPWLSASADGTRVLIATQRNGKIRVRMLK